MNEDRQYRIIKSDLWFNIYKKLEKNGYISLWFLWPDEKRVLNKDHARTFYHRGDAESALILTKVKDRWKTPITSTRKSESDMKGEKRSWSEL